MKKIDMIEAQEAESTLKQAKLDVVSASKLYWKDYLELYGYNKESRQSLEEMCIDCIKKQEAAYGRQSIKCTGLATYKNKTISKFGEEIYKASMESLSPEEIELLDYLENPIQWLDYILEEDTEMNKTFDPRWYQTKILNCSSTRKVLRMGRRCIDGEEKIKGKKKDYKIKHLYHLAKHNKKLPLIATFNEETLETSYTDKYYLVPNVEKSLLQITYDNHTSNTITVGHPLYVFKGKQLQFVDAYDLNVGDKVITYKGEFLTITNIKPLHNRQSYHISVLGTETFITANEVINHNTGKALDVNTPIPTPTGWTTMGTIKVGDKVFDDTGKECNVTYITDYQYDRNCYKLVFDDGSSLIADLEHQWNVIPSDGKEVTLTTRELLDYESKDYKIRLTGVVQYPERETKTNFYTTGYTALEGLDEELLISSEDQRLELLRGLMDSNGIISSDRYVLVSAYRSLALDVLQLVKSLGIKATIEEDPSGFLVVFTTHFRVFKTRYTTKTAARHSSNYLYITSITPVESVPVKCISVDSPTNLYLAGKDYVVTHNTASMTVGLLHKLLTHNDYRVLMVAPMATMIDEVFDTVKKYCDKMAVNPIKTASTTPIHEIVFETGSTFKGVTAGAQGAKGTRGKGADLIYIDECLTAFARITMSDGRTKAIVDVEEGEYVLAYDETTGKFNPQRVLKVKCTGVKEVYKYKTITGKTISATTNHPVLTSEGWKDISEAKDIGVITSKNAVFYEKIISSVYKSTEKVYNLTVDKTHTYIADGFVVHNCDFLSAKDLNSILAILVDTAHTEFWASSTPMGEGNLFRLSKDPKYKEFHYPTYASPMYNDDVDNDFKSQMDQIGIIQEILAEFGADDNMVFQIPFIERITIPKEQEVDIDVIFRNRHKDYNIIMGVDWNHDKVGTRIVVGAQHRLTKKIFVAEKSKVAVQGWTQLLAVEEIIRLNRKWNCDFIYVDEGFGTTQAAMLRQEGLNAAAKGLPPNHPDYTLIDTISISFRATLVIPDPITGLDIRKQTKQFIVENTVNYLGEERFQLQEDIDRDIILQLKNYYVKSRSSSGLKVYSHRDKNIGDHDLDALMMVLFGFKEHFDEDGLSSYSSLPISNTREDFGYVQGSPMRTEVAVASEQVIINKHSGRRSNGRKHFKPRSSW